MQLVRGLPPEYDVKASIINQNTPSWDEARTMLQREQQRQAARSNPNQSVLVSSQNPSHQADDGLQPHQHLSAVPDHNRFSNQPYGPNRPRGRGYRGRGRGHGYRGNRQQPQWWQSGPQ
ncbi:hypothetical protein Hdeb2414_s0004g00126441 [Helianthus debilis subsp. tardiflorus]